ncbi:MAG TPA: hypothetical protein VEA81_19295 [Burkholderiaceae bacterium]|nr:hypothetical protein [Burkholderiaceae bacterium]
MDPDLEGVLFRLLSYSLVRHLQLRPECADAVYFELFSERELVHGWLRRQAGHEEYSAAIALAARDALPQPA